MNSSVNLHPIQETIIKRLGYDDEKSFSEIKGDFESNKFSFHLKKLRESDLIEKKAQGYILTSKGREILPYFDLENERHPVIVVDLLVFSEGSVYLLDKEEDPLDPFSGEYRTPSTRISKNERLRSQAEDLYEKHFGENPEELENSAVFDSQISFKDGSKQHYLLFFYSVEKNHDQEENLFAIEDLDDLDTLPGLGSVIQKIKNSDSSLTGQWDVSESEKGFEVKEFKVE